jgi:hypothetical protein
MSKVIVQMCTSTIGFGTSIENPILKSRFAPCSTGYSTDTSNAASDRRLLPSLTQAHRPELNPNGYQSSNYLTNISNENAGTPWNGCLGSSSLYPTFDIDLDYMQAGMDILNAENSQIMGGMDNSMNLGFGLGWEGKNHDFSKGN